MAGLLAPRPPYLPPCPPLPTTPGLLPGGGAGMAAHSPVTEEAASFSLVHESLLLQERPNEARDLWGRKLKAEGGYGDGQVPGTVFRAPSQGPSRSSLPGTLPANVTQSLGRASLGWAGLGVEPTTISRRPLPHRLCRRPRRRPRRRPQPWSRQWHYWWPRCRNSAVFFFQ